MIPAFDPTTGYLPIGIHDASWEEFAKKYGYTTHRMSLINGLYQAVQDLKSCGCSVIYPDGSFITDKHRPGDIDVCWDTAGVDIKLLRVNHPIFWDATPGRKQQKLMYGCEFFGADWIELASGEPFLEFFQKYYGAKKGILKIKI